VGTAPTKEEGKAQNGGSAAAAPPQGEDEHKKKKEGPCGLPVKCEIM